MLCKLAWGNVRRAGRDYLVYLLTLTLGVTVFYAFNTISMQVDIAGIDEKGLAQVMGSMLGDLTYFLAGVMAFLMVYANNFIMIVKAATLWHYSLNQYTIICNIICINISIDCPSDLFRQFYFNYKVFSKLGHSFNKRLYIGSSW